MTSTLASTIAAAFANVAEFSPGGSAEAERIAANLPQFHGARYEIAGVVRPSNAEELAAAVRAAREQDLAILRLYGASKVGARLSGDGPALVVDLGRMNRVLDIDPDHATVRVEPGVTFAQLAAHLKQEGIPLLVDSERDPGASVVGSIFSKGIGRTPYGDHLLVHCGGEYMLPDGRLVRTGMGAMENSPNWQVYKYSLGPYSDGLAVQSDQFIPTQAGLWVMGEPPAMRHFAFDVADDAGLSEALEALRPLKLANMLPGTVVISHRDFDRARGGTQRGATWRLQSAVYGVPRVVEFSLKAVASALGNHARPLSAQDSEADPIVREEAALFAGRPGLAPLTISQVRNPGFLTFVAPIEGQHARAMKATADRVLEGAGGPALVELLIVGRSLLANCYLPNFAAAGRAGDLVDAMGEAGFGVVAQSPDFDRIVTQKLGTGVREAVLEKLEGRWAAG